MKMAFDRKEHEVDTVVELARQEWAKLYGFARVGSRARTDLGASKRKGDATTEAGWLRQRRESVAAVVGEAQRSADAADPCHGSDGVAAEAADLPGWCEEHQKELTKQVKKERKRKVETLKMGALLPHEVSGQVLADAEEAEVQKEKMRKVRVAKHRRGQLGEHVHVVLPTREGIRGWTVYIDAAVDNDKLRDLVSIRLLRPTDAPLESQLIICPNPAKLGQGLSFAACIAGTFVATPDFLIDENQRGAVLKFHRACSLTRKIFLTTAFRKRHAKLVRIMDDASRLPGSQWTILPDLEDYKRRFRGAQRTHRTTYYVVLGTKQQTKDRPEGIPAALRILHWEAFLEFVSRVSLGESSTGVH